MKDGVRIINCARGGHRQRGDCCDALRSGKVAGAALDVFVEEPTTDERRSSRCANFISTPHLGAASERGAGKRRHGDRRADDRLSRARRGQECAQHAIERYA